MGSAKNPHAFFTSGRGLSKSSHTRGRHMKHDSPSCGASLSRIKYIYFRHTDCRLTTTIRQPSYCRHQKWTSRINMTGVVIDRLIHMPRKYPDILTQVPNTSKPTCKSKVHVQRSGPLIADFENVVFSKYHSKLLSILYTRDLTLNKYTT